MLKMFLFEYFICFSLNILSANLSIISWKRLLPVCWLDCFAIEHQTLSIFSQFCVVDCILMDSAFYDLSQVLKELIFLTF